MSGRYLLFKFGFVALLVLLCLGSLFWGNGLKMGPDIAGGYSMIFEVRNPGDTSDLIDQVIRILKQRVDPTGLSSLEWRPLQNDRFEVRMPAASPQSQALRNEYLQARDGLLDRNVERSEVRQILPLDSEQRNAALTELTGGNEKLTAAVNNLLAAMESLAAAEKQLDAVEQRINSTEELTDEQAKQLQQDLQQARQAVAAEAADYRLELAALREANINPRELQATLKLYDEALAVEGEQAKEAAMETFRARVERLKENYPARSEAVAAVVDKYTAWADIRRPLEDPGDLIRLIRKAGVLEFRIAPRNADNGGPIAEAQIDLYRRNLDEEGPQGLRDAGEPYAWFPLADEEVGYGSLITHDYAGRRYLLLSNRPGETLLKARGEEGPQWQLDQARRGSDQNLAPAVNFQLNTAGARLFAELTGNNIDRAMAILLDDEVYSAPNIQSAISSSGQITGKFTVEEVDELVRILNAGSLPGRVNSEPVSEVSFGAAIGEQNMKLAMRSAIYGLIVVAIFMLIYYWVCGAIADVALCLNIILVLGAMSMFQAVLTLPGIAGVILTIGMAVDANVLIFERLREEQARNLPVGQALKNAYERAFTAIIDANITTLLICLFLFVVFKYVGMEEVRGFAITLGLGVAFSMFTALVVTRWIFQLLLDTKILRNPLKMLRLVPVTHVNWMGKRYAFWLVSLAMVVLGIGSLLWQGSNILGIEFSSGTQAIVKFRDGALVNGELPNDGLVRREINAQAEQMLDGADADLSAKLDRLIATARVETLKNENRVDEFLRLYGNDQGVVTLAGWTQRDKSEAFFKRIDANDDGTLSRDELQARLPQSSYQLTTTLTDAKLIRDIANEAFGRSLQRRTPVDFELVAGEMVPAIGVRTDPSGVTEITPAVLEGVTTTFRDDLLDFEGGVMFVVSDVTPPVTTTDVRGRIRDIRLQPDFGPWAVNPYRVVGLASAEQAEAGFGSFLVLVRPADPDVMDSQTGREQFLTGERDVLSTALQREEAMVATNFDAAIAGQTGRLAIVVIVLSWLAIVAYLWVRFGSVRWGLAAVVCLVHDVIIVLGLVAATGWLAGTAVGDALGLASFKLDLPMVAALLTVIGYSVNDTIVIFDRIRENRGKRSDISPQIINDAINQSLPRTLLTSFTTFLVVFIMYVWGGPGIKSFNYALLMGIIFGTYSSMAVASPLLLGFKQALVAKTTTEEENQ